MARQKVIESRFGCRYAPSVASAAVQCLVRTFTDESLHSLDLRGADAQKLFAQLGIQFSVLHLVVR